MNPAAFKRTVATMMSFGLLLAQTGCMNMPGDGDGNDQPPNVPAASTMVIDFGGFAEADVDQDDSSGKQQTSAQMIPGGNWLFAAANVAIWNSILTITLVVPVAAFAESFNHEPTFQGGGAWTWSYDVEVAGVTYTAALTGTLTADGVDWSMLVSQEGGFTDVEWFTGQSNFDATEGTWTLNRDPNNPRTFIQIDWTRDQTPGFSDIRFTNIEDGSQDNGSFIYATETDGAALDITYSIFNVRQDNTTDIEWSRDNLEGRVRDLNQFGDDAFRCWDQDLQNVDCDGSSGDPDDTGNGVDEDNGEG